MIKRSRAGLPARPHKMMILALIFLLIITINCSYNTPSPASFVSGMYYGVEKVDSLIYCATGRGLEIFLLKNNHPKLLSRYATDGVARACEISGQYTFVADDYKGLCILDISNPEVPRQIGSYSTHGQTRDVLVQGNYAYLADYNKGFIILDVSNPSSPYLVGLCDHIDCATWVKIEDTLAYVGVLGAPFKIINIVDPTNPHIVGEFPQDSFSYGADICFDDTLAYINCRMQINDSIISFAVINMKNPARPRFMAGISVPSTGRGMVKKGNFVCTNTYNEGVFIIDVTDPLVPVIAGQYKNSNYSGNGIALDDNLLIVPHLVDGFSIADMRDPKEPKVLHHNQNVRWEYFVIDDSLGYLYLLGNIEDMNLVRRSFLKIVDIKVTDKLVCCGELSFSGRGSLSEGSYDYPYLLMTNRRGHPRCDTLYTEVINIRNPHKPRVVKSVNGGGIIEFHSPNIYALDGWILKKGDINNSHIWTDDINLQCRGNDFVVWDTLVYIITNDSLMIVNINSAGRVGGCCHNKPYATNISFDYPYLVSTYSLSGPGHTYGFLMFDVRDEETPALLIDTIIYGDTLLHKRRSLFTVRYSMSCELRDTLLYMGRGVYGFDIWKIKPPRTVIKLLTQDTPYIATHCYPSGNGNLHVYKDYVFLIDYIVGLEIYKLSNLLNGQKE